MPIDRSQPGEFTDNEPGQQGFVRFAFEEWAQPDDQQTAIVTEECTTSNGRALKVGDLITPREARAEHVRWRSAGAHRITTDRDLAERFARQATDDRVCDARPVAD